MSVVFRHPLVRSAVYKAATPAEVRAAHRALADAMDPDADLDRWAWHRGQSIIAPDESVAELLERSADQAYARGGMAAAAGFLERATALTPDPTLRAARALSAAEYKYRAGDLESAHRLLAVAEAGPLDARRRALAAQIVALPAQTDAPSLLFGVARGLEAHDEPRAYETYLETFGTAVRSGRLGDQQIMTETARAARAVLDKASPNRVARPLDLLLEALTTQVIEGQIVALPMAQAAIGSLLEEANVPTEASSWTWLAHSAALDLGDEESWSALVEREARLVRRAGALIALPLVLCGLAVIRVHFGELAEAATLLDEAYAVNQDESSAVSSWAGIMPAAWQGEEESVTEFGETGAAYARQRSLGLVLTMIDHATAVMLNATGRYELALRAARTACHQDDLGYRLITPPELIEAAVRSGHSQIAEPVLRQLVERTDGAGTDLALGLQYRSRALLSTGSEAEELFQRAIDRLARSRAAGHAPAVRGVAAARGAPQRRDRPAPQRPRDAQPHRCGGVRGPGRGRAGRLRRAPPQTRGQPERPAHRTGTPHRSPRRRRCHLQGGGRTTVPQPPHHRRASAQHLQKARSHLAPPAERPAAAAVRRCPRPEREVTGGRRSRAAKTCRDRPAPR
ncbi:hypothetical protein QWU11_24430 [Actinomadura sp. DC4]|nr:hypothetical protein [Actinomadura sp. DC4]MDN3355751.1 hypothetical protein [Actinomadura sp. DC4]